ncbi:MAG: 1-deoxy-D-xylulose-5-phosphate reductoisomerase, partial [Mucinivorans sp.]
KLVSALSHTTTKVYSGAASVEQAVASSSVEVVVSAIVGFAGLAPTVAAVRAGKKVALANKESLVVGGELLVPLSVKCKAPLVPVDSEHSAIFQCLVGESSPLKRVIITASGGALRDMTAEQAKVATVEQVLRHPC